MSTIPNQKQVSAPLSGEEPLESTTAETTENMDILENASEVSMRLNLLGKLIIPPDPR